MLETPMQLSMENPSLPKGVRDFTPAITAKRYIIIDAIKTVFQCYGFLQLETSVLENLSTLTGKYGAEGDQLIFKILNSGDYLKDIHQDLLQEKDIKKITKKISNKGLRYDLTVPCARYVAMHRHEITFPFRRFQLQPVWRADRPQKGRYREFHQCDADIIGSRSLLCEAEIMVLITDVFRALHIQDYRIKINHRAILSGLWKIAGNDDKEAFFTTLDKWDKIGKEKVWVALSLLGIDENRLIRLFEILEFQGDNKQKLHFFSSQLESSEETKSAIKEVEKILAMATHFCNASNPLEEMDRRIEIDIKLARGLSYYTGTVFEIVADNTSFGSLGGGGRYDNLTAIFGLPNVSGIGLSFGIERIYDTMETLNLFSNQHPYTGSTAIVVHLDERSMVYGINVLKTIRKHGISTEIYPDQVKIKKQLDYANRNKIPFVVIIGEEEIKTKKFVLKDMRTGTQQKLSVDSLIKTIQHTANQHNEAIK